MAETADFLVEIGTEELPPKALRKLELAFASGVQTRLGAAGLAFETLRSFASPRRLAVLVESLQLSQPEQKIEKRGPPVRIAFDAEGNPTKAASAFASGFGVAISDLERVVTEKGEWLEYRGTEPGKTAAELLPDFVAESLAELPIPKRMRWGSSDVEFVRPAHWIVMLLGKKVLPAKILGIAAGRTTRGHRFHAPEEIKIKVPADYSAKLEKEGRVLADFVARRDRVRELTQAAAVEITGSAHMEPEVLDEITALVEWPTPVTGSFDDSFLRLPDEVLISTLQSHQRYIPVRGRDGQLLPNFIAMSNLDSKEPDMVREGNERVVLPRLADAAFFWDQDRKATLESRREALEQVVFQKELGSLADKSARVAALARGLAADLGYDADAAERAAELAKTDLLTEMVGEFPELQGRIGYYYADLDGEPDDVARAIEEQYLPTHAGDQLPTTPIGRVLAIADRLDSLAGIFAVGKRPSGNKDPFGLRRAALGVLRILVEEKIDLDLAVYIEKAVAAQPVTIEDRAALASDIYDFVIDRLRSYVLDGQAPGFGERAISPEVFEAVRVRSPSSPMDFVQRVSAVDEFMQHDAAESLAAANKRIANILKSADTDASNKVDSQLFEELQETTLFKALMDVSHAHTESLERRDYQGALQRLASLREPVDAFFDDVMVMTEDADRRRNRVALLGELRQRFLDIADLSCIHSS
ncbi:MAG: glycine--tRNA ligase subunit beta [Gammaproteobacteria bacterium]|nr:glycine--tRNA ligase subunit beta [Gammaproteobacteria bacterium]